MNGKPHKWTNVGTNAYVCSRCKKRWIVMEHAWLNPKPPPSAQVCPATVRR